MISELNQTPKAMRMHIGVFGDTNAGKSTFINAVTGQEIALTSPVPGTTTDPVYKPMELLPLGPVVFIDTAGLDDTSDLGEIRIKKSLEQLNMCDAAVLVVNSNIENAESQNKYIKLIADKKIPYIIVINEIDFENANLDFSSYKVPVVSVNLHDDSKMLNVKDALIHTLHDKVKDAELTSDLVKEGDTVLLIAPQDIQAPKGRLILPQVQTIRDLLDNKCIVITVTSDNILKALDSLIVKPSLIITDSQIFNYVNKIVPKDIPLTSFSLLMAKIKGDINEFINGARYIDHLEDGDNILILESCAHHALDDDIARAKLPAMIRKYTGRKLTFNNVSGQKVLSDLSKYKLAIHCGGCMINRKAMLSKQDMFKSAGLPMTNFGIAIAYMNGMLDRVCY